MPAAIQWIDLIGTGRQYLVLVWMLCLISASSALASDKNPVGTLYPLTIVTQSDEITLQVEIARTRAEMARGLMYRTSMPRDQGMIFLHSQPKHLRMWMKNTLIGLDMLFIDDWSKVQHIHRGAIPHDETVIAPPVVSVAVLELNAGTSERLGIQVGDTVHLSTSLQ